MPSEDKKAKKGRPAKAKEAPSKSTKDKPRKEGKKKTKRGNVSSSAVKKLLREGAASRATVKRVSAKAIKRAKEHTNSFIKTLAQHLNRYSTILEKKKTLDSTAIRNVVANDLKKLGVSDASIMGGKPLVRGLSRAGVARQLKKSQLNLSRLSSEFRDALLNLCEMYVRLLGTRAADFSQCAKRKTLLAKDIDAAARALLD